jgi:hypothetical protein
MPYFPGRHRHLHCMMRTRGGAQEWRWRHCRQVRHHARLRIHVGSLGPSATGGPVAPDDDTCSEHALQMIIVIMWITDKQ